ncbi:MAG: hypothetical protein JO210_09920 [Acidobacteriaceae bacterium]|nr:hypothetical protein [Acidobacteriaceae bacterium]
MNEKRAALISLVLLIAAHTGNLAFASGDSISVVVRKSAEVNSRDWQAQAGFSDIEREVKSKVDENGRAISQPSKTYESMMIEGSPYRRLMAVNDEPLRGTQKADEEAKLVREIARRRDESTSERRARITKYNETRSEEHLLMQQMVSAFKFKLLGEEEVDGVSCYHLLATPDPDYHPPVEKARVLTGMRGQMWIDEQQYHWVKVKAEVIEPVSFGFFIARVKPGTEFDLLQAPVGDFWLPKRFAQKVNASVLGIYGYRAQQETYYSDYKQSPLRQVGQSGSR